MRFAISLLRRCVPGLRAAAGTPRRRGVYRPADYRPQLEGLEDRLVMSTIVVDPTPGKGNYTTIQAAVNAASPGDVINIDTATYQEQVVVSKNLTLETTPGQARATIQAPTAAPLTGSLDIVDFTGSTVTGAKLQNLNIQGPAPDLKAGVNVEQGATGVTITGNTISAIKDKNNIKLGDQTGVGILIGGNTGGVYTAGGATVSSNTVSDYQKCGIVINYAGSSASVSGNTVTGTGKTNALAQNGIQVGFGATATVSGNTVSGNIYGFASPTTYEAADILLYQPGSGTSASGNTVSSCDVGIWALDAAGATIANNNVSGFGYAGIALDVVSTGCSNVTVNNNSVHDSNGPNAGIIMFNATGCTITNNTISACGDGIWLAAGDTNNRINANTISTSSVDGIVIADYDPTKTNGIGTTSTSSGNTISSNKATGSGSLDALDVSTGSGTAGTANTWSGNTFKTKSPGGLK
jgi:parallel beta-helix repeat protein